MKYPKVLQVLLVASMVTTAAPGAAMPVYASAVEDGGNVGEPEERETPEEFEERTEYELPEGYHYVLEDEKYVTFDEDGEPVIEKDGEEKKGEEDPDSKSEEGNDSGTGEADETEENEADGAEESEIEEDQEGEPDESGEASVTDDAETDIDIEENVEGEPVQDGDAGEADNKDDNSEDQGEADDKEDNTDNTGSINGAGINGGVVDSNPENPGNTEDSDSPDDPGSAEEPGKTEDPDSPDNPDNPDNPDDPEDPDNPDNPDDPEDPDDPDNPDNPDNPDDPDNPGNPGDPGSTGDNKDNNTTVNNGIGGSNGNIVIGNKKEIGIKSAPDKTGKRKSKKERKRKKAAKAAVKKAALKSTGAKPASEKEGASRTAKELVKEALKKQAETDADFETSAKFLKLGERIRYNVEVPIEGLPSFITQEMIIGALKAQDETGYPASVTIAQIIQESGYGKYGPGGLKGEGLSYLAYQYCNLFGIKGKGTIGSAKMNTFEMTAGGQTYSTQAGFRAYNTYTECIEDRSKLLDEVYSDLTANVTDANTFAVKIGSRWATDINYSRSLIRTMGRYDLYRLDELTLTDFSKLIGRFADPCPGATVSSTYGYRTFDHSFHKGLDLGTGTENIPTYAADAGTVIFAGEAGTAGNMVVIDHGEGLITKYMHHYEVFVEEGQEVEKGQQIGLSGTTGYSTGNHLHFQVEENGKAVDPMKYLSDEGSGEIVKMRERDDKSKTDSENRLLAGRAFVKANRFNADKLAEELSVEKIMAKLRDCMSLHKVKAETPLQAAGRQTQSPVKKRGI